MSQSSLPPGLPFREAVTSRGMLYISGQIGIDPATQSLPSAGFEAEAYQVMKNLGAVLRRAGLTYNDLVSVTIYLKSMENYAVTNAVYSRYFSDVFPARVCIAVHDLPLKARIEIAAVAERKEKEKQAIPYHHVDVFSEIPLSGNGLTVFPESKGLSKSLMQSITREMRQFESIFLQHREGSVFDANVFTMEEELDFAGHPSLGAAALLHDLLKPTDDEADWVLAFPSKKVPVVTKRKAYGYEGTMNQGPAIFGKVLTDEESRDFLRALGLGEFVPNPAYPLQVVSTGLPYLVIPVEGNSLKARILVTDLAERLQTVGAKFAGILDISARSIRTWDNLGHVEDIATGSLAGPAAAYLVKYGVCGIDEPILIHQGKNLGRESQLRVRVTGGRAVSGGHSAPGRAVEGGVAPGDAGVDGEQGDIYVGGDVVKVAEGRFWVYS